MKPNGLRGHAERNQWTTPRELFNRLDDEFRFTHDAACDDLNALAQPIGGNALRQPRRGTVFVNPPYAGRELKHWVRKGYESAQEGATVVMLLPVRTSVAWWHDYALRGEVRFLRGRLKFGGRSVNAPFDSVVVVFRPHLATLIAEPPHA